MLEEIPANVGILEARGRKGLQGDGDYLLQECQ